MADPSRVELLVVAAHPVELEALRGLLQRKAPSDRLPMVTDDVGVGLAAAGAGTAQALARHRPAGVLLVGSAGVYPGHSPPIGGVIATSAVHLVDSAVVAGQAAFPAPMEATPPIDGALLSRLIALPDVTRASAATTLAITTDDDLATTLASGGPWEVENLEAFAVALACQRAGVAFAALLGITNVVGSSGRRQWLDNHRTSAAQVAELVRQLRSA